MNNLSLSLMFGIDIRIPECLLIIHQPSIKEIAYIGELDFFTGIQCLCVQKTMVIQDESVLQNISNFQIFMTLMTEEQAAEKKQAVETVCLLLFPKYKTLFTPQSIIFRNKDNNTVIIDETNFEFLQKTIAKICCIDNSGGNNSSYNPGNKKAKEIADKIMRGRQKVAEQKGESSNSIFTQYLSVLTVGLKISLLELMNITMYQMYDLLERYSLYTNWDIDIRARLAGAQMDSEPSNWMKNIH